MKDWEQKKVASPKPTATSCPGGGQGKPHSPNHLSALKVDPANWDCGLSQMWWRILNQYFLNESHPYCALSNMPDGLKKHFSVNAYPPTPPPLARPGSLRYLSSPTKIQGIKPPPPAVEAWTVREVP